MVHKKGILKILAASVLLIVVVLRMRLTSSESRAPDQSPTNGVVVLTFDGAVKSHRTVVAPLLQELHFGATFFVTHLWMNDSENFLNWQEIAEIYRMGFEIGNHSWTHADFSVPKNAARLAAEIALVENELQKVGVPRPRSFAYSGNGFGPEAVEQLDKLGYKFGRRGMQPEVEYGQVKVGPAFDPHQHHRLLIPTTGDAYPNWTTEHFKRVVEQARKGRLVVLQFHGVPDPKHPWVSTPPELFREYMAYLKQQRLRVIALRDLQEYLPNQDSTADPMRNQRYPEPKHQPLELPAEIEATRNNLGSWLENMLRYHRYTWNEAAGVTGFSVDEVRRRAQELGLNTDLPARQRGEENIQLLPYPGGRHPRIGFLEAAILPQRGTKASVFLPWNSSSYVVVDLPEAIFSNLGLIYLAHTHIPTIWDAQNVWLENIDWNRDSSGKLGGSRRLPNGIHFGASISPSAEQIEMELWLRNDTRETLSGLRTQICVLLKGAPDFNAQTNDNKLFQSPVSAVRSLKGDHWILTAWERCGRTWGNALCPCLHSDPVLPDCPPGKTVRVRGRLWFCKGTQIAAELERAKKIFPPLPEGR